MCHKVPLFSRHHLSSPVRIIIISPSVMSSHCVSISTFLDATYADPLGEAPARPKTAGRQRHQPVEDEFGDEELGDDLLPE